MPQKHMISSYDIIGDIAIFELPDDSRINPKKVAENIIETHSRIRTVLQKTGERRGILRLRSYRRIIGNGTETVHKEHGFRFRLDPTKVYFSPRESTERMRIAGMVEPGETVMIMFAGVGPFGIVIAGKQPAVRKVYQVELNPDAFEYMKQNIAMNKLGHKIIPLFGDAREVCKDYEGMCDRVVMPLPRESHKYLDTAINCLKGKGIIHFYSVGRSRRDPDTRSAEDKMFSTASRNLENASKKLGRNVRILSKRRVLPFSPGAWKICIDAEITS